MLEVTIRIATLSLFGKEYGRDTPLVRAQENSLASVISPSVIFAQWDIPGAPYRRFLDNVVSLNDETQKIIDACRQHPQGANDLLTTLVKSAPTTGLTDEQIIGHVGVLLAASHETTAFATTVALLLLTQHPAIAADLVEEINGKLRGAEPDAQLLREMPLLDSIVNESLRLLPPAPWTARESVAPSTLLDYEIEPGTELIPSIFHTHRMPEIWPDADHFKPERWSSCNPSPYEFNPFGGGPRMCIGRNFATVGMRLILSTFLSRFRVECTENRVDPCMSITMSFRSGVPVRVFKSDGQWIRNFKAVTGDIRRYVQLNRE